MDVNMVSAQNMEWRWRLVSMEKTTSRTLNEMLVKLFNNVMDAEEKAVITEEFKDITNNDMHIIEAIGIEEPRRMSDIAKRLDVTMGTLTTLSLIHISEPTRL